MFKNIILFGLLIISSVCTATEQPVYLATPVKEQTGMYFVEADYIFNFGGILPNTGVSLEIVEPPNRLVPGGQPATNIFVFGTFYDITGTYFLFSGTHSDDNSLPVVVYKQESNGDTVVIGSGTLTVDTFVNGNAHKIRFDFVFTEGYEYMDSPVLSGYLLRSTNVQINRCKYALDFSPVDPYDNKACNPAE